MNTIYSFKKVKAAFAILLAAIVSPFISNAQVDYLIGNGTTSNTYSQYPTPYGQWFESSHAQFLFLASELTSAGMGPGVITAIKWDVTSLNNGGATYSSGNEPNFTVKIGTTTVSSLSAMLTPTFTTVFGPTNYQPVVGINAYTIPTPFIWNGTDNIIIDVCQGNGACVGSPSGYTCNASVNFTNTSFNSAISYYSDCSGSLCGVTGLSSTHTQRPNTIFTYGQPCSGVPVTEVSGPNEVCPNKSFTLGFTTFFSGITVQWQTSLDGINWTNWTGTVNPGGLITDVLTADKWYRCKVTCTSSGQTYTTQPKHVKIAPFYYCYCDGSKATSTASGMDIGNVTTIRLPGNAVVMSNGTGTPLLSNAGSNKSYSDFRYTVPPIPMYHDSMYKLLISQINANSSFTAGTAAVYIDFNRNGKFDVYERVLLGTTVQSPPTPGVLTDTFIVPDTAGYGLTGMRVILKTGTAAPDTCLSYTDGETEDYLVDLRYLPCDTVTTAGTVEGDTSICTGYDYLLVDSTYQTRRYGLSKLWQLSADAKSWYDIPGTANQDTIMRVFTGQPLFYRLRMVCDVTHDTLNSDPHKMNLKAAYKCYCFSQAVGGPSSDSSDIGAFHIYNFDVNDGGAHLGNPRAVRKRQDFTDLAPIELDVDSTYEIHVYHTMPRDQHADAKITVFMDFNNDHKYNIPQERVFTGFTDAAYHTVISNIVILDSAIVNVPTGMRIVLNNNVSPNVPSDEACGTYTSGETEDYIVMFKRPFPSGVQELKAGLEHMQLYPNPGNGKFTIRFHSMNSGQVKVKIATMTGQAVLNKEYNHKGGWFTESIEMNGQPNGVYFVEIETAGIKATRKLVIQ